MTLKDIKKKYKLSKSWWEKSDITGRRISYYLFEGEQTACFSQCNHGYIITYVVSLVIGEDRELFKYTGTDKNEALKTVDLICKGELKQND